MNTRLPAPAGRLARLGGAATLVAGTFLALGSGAAGAQSINFSGYTDGCFNCTPTQDSSAGTSALNGLTFRDSTFSVNTASGFAAIGQAPATPNVDNLGSFDFALGSSPFTFNGNGFNLMVTFTTPPGTSPNPFLFSSALTGSVNGTDNGGVFIDFDNAPKSFTFGSGASAGVFTFQVNDLSFVSGGSLALSGVINVRQVSAIPEPETYALMMAGLAAVGFMSRRRKKA